MRSTDRRLIFLLAAVAIMCCMSVASACEICGYKYEKIGDGTVPVQGWTIDLYTMVDGNPVYLTSTTTDEDGKYCFIDGQNLLPYDNTVFRTYRVYEEVRDEWTQLYPTTGYHEVTFVTTMSDLERKISGKNFINQRNEVCYKGETAWADGTRYVTKGNWATYTPYQTSPVTIYAGQTIPVGTATFSAPADGKVTITINLNNGALFADVKENLKVQDYATAPPAKNPAPGKFMWKKTCTGTECSITVPANNFYGIHLDVKVPC